MKERPILFNAEMVKAILAGAKIQTRRVIKPQPEDIGLAWCWKDCLVHFDKKNTSPIIQCCPYGQVGDRLWVRETWCLPDPNDNRTICYRASNDPVTTGQKWQSSRFMPRWASRITLEITEVRVERVQEISVEDCISEGYPFGLIPEGLNQTQIAIARVSRRGWFQSLWDSLNAKRGYGWEVNPWCWCISFKMVDK